MRDGALPMDRPVGAGGDRSDRNGPGYVGPDLGLVKPSRGPAAGLAELAGGRVPGTATRSPVARRGATTPPDGKFGAPLPASSAASAGPACAPRDRPLTLCHLLVAQGSCEQIDKMAAGPTYSAGGRRAPAAALLVDPSTTPAWRVGAQNRAHSGWPTFVLVSASHTFPASSARPRVGAENPVTASDQRLDRWLTSAITARRPPPAAQHDRSPWLFDSHILCSLAC